MSRAAALQGLAAVLADNGLYFLFLYPRLPTAWQHQPFSFDLGLALNFFLCLGFYVFLRRLTSRRRQ